MDLLITTLCRGLAGFFKFYIVACTIRIYVEWFPNINKYEQPLATIVKLTNPYMKIFRGIIPPILGFDLSPLMAFALLPFLIDILSSVTVSFA